MNGTYMGMGGGGHNLGYHEANQLLANEHASLLASTWGLSGLVLVIRGVNMRRRSELCLSME